VNLKDGVNKAAARRGVELSIEEQKDLTDRCIAFFEKHPSGRPGHGVAFFEGMLDEIAHRPLLRKQRNDFLKQRNESMALTQRFYEWIKAHWAAVSPESRDVIAQEMFRAERLTRSGYEFPMPDIKSGLLAPTKSELLQGIAERENQ